MNHPRGPLEFCFFCGDEQHLCLELKTFVFGGHDRENDLLLSKKIQEPSWNFWALIRFLAQFRTSFIFVLLLSVTFPFSSLSSFSSAYSACFILASC